MSHTNTHAFDVGRFRITPLTRSQGESQHIAVLSIRSGQGTETRDRIYTFKPEFKTKDSALMYAAAQGRYWLINPASLS